MLDYDLGYTDRINLIKKIEYSFGEELSKKYFYYKQSNLKRHENKTEYDKICSLYDVMSEYILFCDNVERSEEYPYAKESNSSSLVSPDDISLEKYMHIVATDESGKKHYDYQNHAEYKIEDFKKDAERFPEIAEYINYGKLVLEIINKYEKKKKQYERIKSKLKEQGKKKRLKKINKMWLSHISANHNHNGHCFKNDFTYAKYIKALKNGTGYQGKTLKKINQDIVAVYKELAGLIYFKNPLKGYEKSTRTCNVIDFFNPEDVKAVFRGMCLRDISDNFDGVLDKMDRIIQKLSLTADEEKVVEIYKRGRGIEINFEEEIKKRFEKRKDFTVNIMTYVCCAELINTHPKNVERIVDKLSKNISDYYVEWYENNVYYMDLVKGKYKFCPKCNNIKIMNENYFGKNKDGKGGFYSICKECKTNYDKSLRIG